MKPTFQSPLKAGIITIFQFGRVRQQSISHKSDGSSHPSLLDCLLWLLGTRNTHHWWQILGLLHRKRPIRKVSNRSSDCRQHFQTYVVNALLEWVMYLSEWSTPWCSDKESAAILCKKSTGTFILLDWILGITTWSNRARHKRKCNMFIFSMMSDVCLIRMSVYWGDSYDQGHFLWTMVAPLSW